MSAKAIEYLTKLLKEVKEFRRRNLDRVEALVEGLKQSLTEIGDLEDSFVMVEHPSPSTSPSGNLVLSTKSKNKNAKRDPWELTLPTISSKQDGVIHMLHKVDEQFERLAEFLAELDGAVSQVFVGVGEALPEDQQNPEKKSKYKTDCPGCKEYDPTCTYYDFCDSLGTKVPNSIVRILHPDAKLDGLPLHPLITEPEKKLPTLTLRELPPVPEEDEGIEDLPKVYGMFHPPAEGMYKAGGNPPLNWPEIPSRDGCSSPDSLFGGSSLGSIPEEEEPEEEEGVIPKPPPRRNSPSPPPFYEPSQPSSTVSSTPQTQIELVLPSPATVVAVEPEVPVAYNPQANSLMKRRDSRDSGLDVDMADHHNTVPDHPHHPKKGYWDVIDYGRETADGYSSNAFLDNYAQSQSIYNPGESCSEDECMSDSDEPWAPPRDAGVINEKVGFGDLDVPMMEEDCGYDVVEGMEL